MFMFPKGIKKTRTLARIPSELYDYFQENRQRALYPQSLTQWVDEQLNEQRLFISNKNINDKIKKIENRIILMQQKNDILDMQIMALQRKCGIFKS